ncbi:hypothetical protein D3C77_809150 [compost metagenome]
MRGQWRHLPRVIAARVYQAAHITTCAKRLVTRAAQQYTDNLRVVGPLAQLLVEHFNHR